MKNVYEESRSAPNSFLWFCQLVLCSTGTATDIYVNLWISCKLHIVAMSLDKRSE
jgi:hypothetical protein